MRIDLLLPDLRAGGAERVSIDLAREFERQGHTVRFVLMQNQGEFCPEIAGEFEIVDLGIPRVRQLLTKLKSHFCSNPPDAIIASMWPLTVVAPAAARLAKCNCIVVVVEHGIISGQYQDWGLLHRAILRLSVAVGYRLAHRRIGVSSGVARDMAELSWMDADRNYVIHNPVASPSAPSSEKLAAVEQMWSVPPGARILTVGRLKPVKNHSLLLKSFAKLENAQARLMIVGDGENMEATRMLAQELKISDRVIFAGFQAEPTPFYKTADLFVLSSDREGFGNVLVESMANGTPVVSTNSGLGPREILERGVFGRLVPVGDVSALTRAMEEVLRETHDTELLKERSLEFLPEFAADAYLELMFARWTRPRREV